MQLGIKIGPDNWHERLEKSQATLCEVWFRIDWLEKYREMFSYLSKNKIKTGLHFWGVINNNIFPQLLSHDDSIRKESIDLFKRTIDIAGENNFYYINAHPEARELFRLIFPDGKVELLNQKTSDSDAQKYLLESTQILTEYGKKKNVLFILETVPRLVPAVWWGEEKNFSLINTGTVPSSWLLPLGQSGIAINFDIGHTMSESISPDPQIQIKELKERLIPLAPYVKLIHLTTTIPPYDRGVDTHNGFETTDYEQGAIPSLEDLKDIISLVSHHNPDLLLIPEPETHHLENYKILQNVLQ